MILWVASYPKSGNTWLRALISSYFYTQDGIYDENLIKLIDQFPTRKFLKDFDYDKKIVGDTSKFWVKAQEKINEDKKLKFFKTHNAFGKINGFDFTNSSNSLGGIYIVRDPRNIITSMTHHYSLNYDQAYHKIMDENASLLEKSYKITKSSGNHFVLNLTDRDFSDGSYSSIAGTSISIYSDRMVSRYTTIPSQNKYMKVTLMCHLGTTDYFKLGSMVAGITFGMQRVPINWTHSVNVNSNTTEFNSRSGVRWAYKEGPSVRTFTGEIEGDVFDEERENIKNIAEQATRFNSYPVAWVFDGDTGENFSPVGDDATAKVHINPKNILYGTINNSLQLANEGWRYDSDNSEWKVVGDLQLTVIEVV